MSTFRAMNTDIHVIAPDHAPRALAALTTDVAALFAASERRYSRFAPDSELSHLNRANGPVAVSAALFAILRRAQAYAVATDGVFEPAIGGALVALGYDRSFAPGALDRAAPAAAVTGGRIVDVVLDADSGRVTRPPGMTIDLGGMVKGHTVDLAAALAGPTVAIDAGGDARLGGDGPDGDGWLVEVEDPGDPARVLVVVRVRDRAVATSAGNRRRWRVGDVVAHHLIDPRTGQPAASGLRQVTALAATAELADVLAKTVFILGADRGAALVRRFPGAGAVLVDHAGGLTLLGEVEVAGEVGDA